jgi:hypothetical protein
MPLFEYTKPGKAGAIPWSASLYSRLIVSVLRIKYRKRDARGRTAYLNLHLNINLWATQETEYGTSPRRKRSSKTFKCIRAVLSVPREKEGIAELRFCGAKATGGHRPQ